MIYRLPGVEVEIEDPKEHGEQRRSVIRVSMHFNLILHPKSDGRGVRFSWARGIGIAARWLRYIEQRIARGERPELAVVEEDEA